jgi:hypothetical protein
MLRLKWSLSDCFDGVRSVIGFINRKVFCTAGGVWRGIGANPPGRGLGSTRSVYISPKSLHNRIQHAGVALLFRTVGCRSRESLKLQNNLVLSLVSQPHAAWGGALMRDVKEASTGPEGIKSGAIRKEVGQTRCPNGVMPLIGKMLHEGPKGSGKKFVIRRSPSLVGDVAVGDPFGRRGVGGTGWWTVWSLIGGSRLFASEKGGQKGGAEAARESQGGRARRASRQVEGVCPWTAAFQQDDTVNAYETKEAVASGGGLVS